jgi:hypothetical protein
MATINDGLNTGVFPLPSNSGGTGVNNQASTITIGGNILFVGPYSFRAVLSANTNLNFPITGTLVTADPGTTNQLAFYATDGSNLSPTTLLAGDGIDISFGFNEITVTNTRQGIPIIVATGTTQAMARNTAYIVGNNDLTTFTLPLDAQVSDQTRIIGYGTNGWALNGGLIHLGEQFANEWSSTGSKNCMELVCVVGSTPGPSEWVVTNVISAEFIPT